MNTLEEANTLINQYIKEVGDGKIFGLLPVSENEQEKIIELVCNSCHGDHQYLSRYLLVHPALIGYAMSVAVSREMNHGNFWSSFTKSFSIEIPAPAREKLCNLFVQATRRLGMLVAEIGVDEYGHRNLLDPVLTHAGIVPGWVTHLTDRIQRDSKKYPLPDPDNEEKMRSYVCRLSDGIPAAQARLKKILISDAGHLVGNSILSAYINQRYELLPHHLKEDVENAFKHIGRGLRLKSPHLYFSQTQETVLIRLPQLTSRIARDNSYWYCNGERYSCLETTDLPIPPNQSKYEVELCNLKGDLENQKFVIFIQLDGSNPLWLFKKDTGKQVIRINKPETLRYEIPDGNYYLVTKKAYSSNEDEYFYELDESNKYTEYESFPDRSILTLNTVDSTFEFHPRNQPCFHLYSEAGFIQTENRLKIYYDPAINIDVYVPTVDLEEDSLISLRFCSVNNKNTERLFSSEITRPASDKAMLSIPLATQWCQFENELDYGIYEIEIEASLSGISFHRRFFYWKGLKYINQAEGIVCDGLPNNLDHGLSIDVEKNANSLIPNAQFSGSEIKIYVNNIEAPLIFNRPGIHAYITEQGTTESRILDEYECLGFAPTQPDIITLHNGDIDPANIYCNDKLICTLSNNRRNYTLRSTSILAQFGRSGKVEVEDSKTKRRRVLFRFAQYSIARELHVKQDDLELDYYAKFVVDKSILSQLRITFENIYKLKPSEKEKRSIDIKLKEGCGILFLDESTTLNVRVTDEEEDWKIEISSQIDEYKTSVYQITPEIRQEESDEWVELQIADKHSLSSLRLILVAPSLKSDSGTNFWEELLHACFSKDEDCLEYVRQNIYTLTEHELILMLEKIQLLNLYKYHGTVWKAAHWIQHLTLVLCQWSFGLASMDQRNTILRYGVHGLCQKGIRKLSIYTQLIIGSHLEIISEDAEKYDNGLTGHGIIPRTLKEVHKVGDAKDLLAYVQSEQMKGSLSSSLIELLQHFGNFNAVIQESSSSFKKFDFQQYLEALGKKARDLDEASGLITPGELLSPSHYLYCLQKLRIRLTPQRNAMIRTDYSKILSQSNAALKTMSDRISQLKHVFARIDYPTNFLDLTFPFDDDQTSLLQSVSNDLFIITGFSRLYANKHITKTEYLEKMDMLLKHKHENDYQAYYNLSLVISLSPELFAFYFLFWEIVTR
tara:strand:- start:7958 stop:11500 length:3543 start_codon:yes stop_codon:yes gene_type:complete